MTASRFHKMLWLYVAILVAGCISGFIQGISEAHQVTNPNDPNAQQLGWSWIYWVYLLGLLIAFVIALIGLFGFARWSRPLSLAVTALGIVSQLFVDPTLPTSLDNVLSEAAATLWGAILALSYFSPVSTRFNRDGATDLRN